MKITIDQFKGFSIVDVYLLDDNGNIVEYKQGLNDWEAESYIHAIADSYNLPNDTIMIDNIFNDDEQLTEKSRHTLGEFLEA